MVNELFVKKITKRRAQGSGNEPQMEITNITQLTPLW